MNDKNVGLIIQRNKKNRKIKENTYPARTSKLLAITERKLSLACPFLEPIISKSKLLSFVWFVRKERK